MNKTKCIHCDPYDNYLHFKEWVEKLLFPISRLFDKFDFILRTRFPRLYSFFNKAVLKGFFKIMVGSGILKEIDVLDNDEQVHSRTLVIARAARERGITTQALRVFGRRGTNLFSMKVNGKKIIFEGLPFMKIGYVQMLNFDDKFVLKQVLQNNGFPYPEGATYQDLKTALRYVEEIGFPLVVKPRCGSLSKHTICNIHNESALREAIRIAKMVSRDFILEKFIPGDVYRITVVDYNMIVCCLREPPNVVGDGIHSIEELVKMKNENPLRGDVHQKNFTLHKIRLTTRNVSLLASHDLTLESIPLEGSKVYLHDKLVLACGADIEDKTDDLHPDNRFMFLKLARLLNAPIVGIDFICQDILIPYYRQQCAIIEANSLPYIDMHHFPVRGQSRDVAGFIIDSILKETILS
jgi:D-alanine-D-alanine ligase-like ATP-grasp enzyme